MPWPQRPGSREERAMRNWFGTDLGDLARLAFVSHRAGRFANPDSRVGMQLCFPQTLGFLLDDPKHPLARNCDFIDYHAYGGKTGDDNCFRNDGIVPVGKSMRAEYEKRKLAPPALMCTETGVPGGPPGSDEGRAQAAAVIKAMVVGASEGLITTCWYALADPSWENMGLIGDASKLPPDGKGAEFRDAYSAMQTASLLLNGTTFVAEVPVKEGAHAYRFRDAAGRDLFVAWLDDLMGPGAKAVIRLPMPRGSIEKLSWDFAKPANQSGGVVSNGQGPILVTWMPVFFRRWGTPGVTP